MMAGENEWDFNGQPGYCWGWRKPPAKQFTDQIYIVSNESMSKTMIPLSLTPLPQARQRLVLGSMRARI